jgi:hypothetical protein
MFLQVRLDINDGRYHRFWWNNEYWQWTRILFGNLASPDISQKVLCMNAELFIQECPLAADAVLNNMYMDDVLKSCETEEEIIMLALQLQGLCSKCGMKICKFGCNSI